MRNEPEPHEALPDHCIAKCQMQWHHLSADETDLVCLSCTARVAVPSEGRATFIADGWDVWLAKAQETFERKLHQRGVS